MLSHIVHQSLIQIKKAPQIFRVNYINIDLYKYHNPSTSAKVIYYGPIITRDFYNNNYNQLSNIGITLNSETQLCYWYREKNYRELVMYGNLMRDITLKYKTIRTLANKHKFE
jgi:hypothetical protein